MNYRPPTVFHGHYDTRAPFGLEYATVTKPVMQLERQLSYRFYSHFHPYPVELVRRLIEGSVRGLQEADTEYAKDDRGRPALLPDSTRVKMPDGQCVILPDGTEVRVADSLNITLPDHRMLSFPNGAEVELRTNADVELFDGTKATYPSGTVAIFLGVKRKPSLYEDIFVNNQYKPSELVVQPYPVKDLDFTHSGAYAVYNWELFYHGPLTIAMHLSKNQRFEEAQRWFHLVFDPTDDSDGPTPERFWRVRPFQYTDVKLIEEILVNLATGEDPELRDTTVKCIDAWKDAPFRPHLVARYRQSPYMFKTVMAYLDNLIAWGDSLFRQDTRESINEATQVYILAANILGPRPQLVPKKGSVRPQTYANLKRELSEFGTVLRELEAEIPFDFAPHPGGAAEIERYNALRSIGYALYFCVPYNDKLLSYWDTVTDRLFKIRNSLNILGIFRQLPLFEPPIDPALLAKAAAAGLDVGAIISGVNQPLPMVRFQFLVQKAMEVCQEVKSLGNGLLSTIEKEDNEALAVLRAKHERVILGLAETVKYSQWQEAIKAREGVEKSFAIAMQRYVFYERLLGKTHNEITIPELEALDADGLEKCRFTGGEPEIQARGINVEIAQDVEGIAGSRMINNYEANELSLLEEACGLQTAAGILDLLASFLSLIPQFDANVQPVGIGASTGFGGIQLSKMTSLFASELRISTEQKSHQAQQNARVGSFARREQEWAFQSNLAAGEITQIFKQLRAAQIREAIAEREWKNHQEQIRNAEEIERFLAGEEMSFGEKRYRKTGTQEFCAWMKRELKGLYGNCFQFAFDIAKKAERAMQHELGDPTLSYLGFGYLAGKEGLLAGEKLYFDIKRMEMSYHDQNCREYELTKHVSLLQIDPLALLQLRAIGNCTVELPEALFDMDCPGHYFRRIKSVAVSIPCVTGPFSSVNCTLTLLKSSIRKNALLSDGRYERESVEDDRFSDHFGTLQSIVTSSPQNDSGMFETHLRDERYLPFEGSGVISKWQLQLPANPSRSEPLQFDYDTINDVIIHIHYTAREGGQLLRTGALSHLSTLIDNAEAAGSLRMLSLRHEFPTEWARFKSIEIDAETPFASLTIGLREEHYPFWSQGRLSAIQRAEVFAKTLADVDVEIAHNAEGTDSYRLNSTIGKLRAGRLREAPTSPTGEYSLYLSTNKIEDLWLTLAWGAGGGE